MAALAESILELLRQGRLAEAETAARALTERQPDDAFGWKVLGTLVAQRWQPKEALPVLERALALAPDDPELLNNLGSVLHALGRLDAARAACAHALARQPDHPVFNNTLGQILRSLSQPAAAARHHRRALAGRPDFPSAHANLGLALADLGQFDAALASLREALRLAPELAEIHNNLGMVLDAQGDGEAAVAAYRRALALQPDRAEIHGNLGIALAELGRLDQALAAYRAALLRKPDHAATYCNLGAALEQFGRFEDAGDCYRQALRLRPDFATAHSNLLFGLNYRTDLSRAQVGAEHREFARRQTAGIRPQAWPASSRRGNDPLRLGLVSGDFRWHAVAFFLRPVLERLDRRRFAVFCYATGAQQDDLTPVFRALADDWIPAVGLTPAELAAQIRRDRIDLLVDLSGHTRGNALLAFAAKPAPVQISWLGYPNTTGLPTMDYRLVDALTDPPDADAFHSERLIRLPRGFLCYQSGVASEELPVTPLPCRQSGQVTFGSFNRLSKLSPATLDLWAAVLRAVPNSRLRLKSRSAADPAIWRRVMAHFAAAGIAPERLEILPRAPDHPAHLDQYAGIDIALDTFPYHGTTTTCEALWMGVPVVTLAGDRHASRVGISLLTRLGRPEWIAAAPADYVRIAAGLAGDPERLADERASLRQRLEASPLGDAVGFTRALEEVLMGLARGAEP